MSQKKYYPNKWNVISKLPDEIFTELCVPFDEFMDWRGDTYQLPHDVECMIRSQDMVNGKVKEYIYKRPEYARKKVRELMKTERHEITIVTHEAYAFFPITFI